MNVWTSLLVGIGALIWLIVSARRHPGREDPATLNPDSDEVGSGSVDGLDPGPDDEPIEKSADTNSSSEGDH